MTHPADQARLRTLKDLYQSYPTEMQVLENIPGPQQVLAVPKYFNAMASGDTLGAAGAATNMLPGYGPAKAAVAQGAAHLLPAIRRGMGLRQALRVNGQTVGNLNDVGNAYDLGNIAGGTYAR